MEGGDGAEIRGEVVGQCFQLKGKTRGLTHKKGPNFTFPHTVFYAIKDLALSANTVSREQ